MKLKVYREDSLHSFVALGFVYLHEKKAACAAEIFKTLRSIAHGEEMYQLAYNISLCQQANIAEDIEQVKLQSFQIKTCFRPITWQAISGFERVIQDTQSFLHSIAKQTRSLALNRAIGELTKIIQTQDQLPTAERGLIVDIAQTWKAAIEPLALEIGSAEITQPVENPYVIGDPVIGQNFAGRDDIMRQLEELWITNKTRQSIVLYGHRRMGKTSILRNATSHIGSTGKVIYINLQRLGEVEEGVGEVLIALSDEIAIATDIEPPSDDDLLKLPKRNFERYLKKVLAEMEGDRLIIALDEFEILEDLIEKGQISKEFLGYLRGLVQMSPKLAFAFAGLHTLEEMTADYFQPFFASVIPIRVSFLNREATFQLLVSPTEDFPLDYEPAALQRIYDLTFGQPYLVQLIGFQLVRRYNDYVFEQGRQRDNLLTTEDVEAIITEDFFRKGRYYFDGVWRQASQDTAGQQQIIKTLAVYTDGLSTAELLELLPLDADILKPALKMLAKHDVIHDISSDDEEPRWQITVELLRIWLENYAPAISE
ncbi:AAA family ATPase [[Limnothrix rosea] IAM M-220]|uniref:AAA family ATPase n=1 Tax=[Limnothrix rosea] IAM M-220 TaxID=454133 RepID=UPI001115835C|nr:ATP-binding protein [[Limnothrix rosea] IAM M-220]